MLAPLAIGGVTFKNRVFASPITTNRIVDHGYPTPEGIDAYETKARGGFAVVTVTESFIDGEYSGRHGHGLNVWSKDMSVFHMESILTLTEAIRAHGAVASIQLNHAGAMNHPDQIAGRNNPIGPSSYVRDDGIRVEGMSEQMMEDVADNWAETALNCKKLGFQMVNLHGAHGWLLNQFISPLTNRRDDEYGGSMENRARFPVMVCDRIRSLCGEDFLIEYRMSGSERTEGGMDVFDGIEFAKIIQSRVDLIHVTSGIYHDHVGTKAFSSMYDRHGCNLDLAEAIKQHVHVPVVSVGGFNGPEQIEEALEKGQCDFAALGRQQFADPEFVAKAMAGKADQIAPCLRCSCFNPLPHDPGKRAVPELWACTVNPSASRELRWRWAPLPKGRRKVAVVGGGAAGLYAAATAAERGHDVTLLEKEGRFGGQLWFTDIDWHKESLRRFRDALIARCIAGGVDMRKDTEATRALLDAMGPDAVICAAGSRPAIPSIKGIGKAYHALEGYKNPGLVKGAQVVLIGGGPIGCETGYFFADAYGSRVRILEMRDDILEGTNASQRAALIPRMEAAGMAWDTGVRVKEVTGDGVWFIDDEDFEERFAAADTVLYATGNFANKGIAENLKGECPWFVVVGDGRQARTVKEATYEGFCAAMDIV